MNQRIVCALVLCCVSVQAAFAQVNWPGFRGPSGGVAEDALLPVSWSTTDNVAWEIIYDRGTVNCYDGRTGKLIYEKKQLANDARAFTVSPWANHGKLFFLSEDGDTFVVQAGPEFKVLGRNALSEMCMATPAALRGSLIIRTLTKLYRIGHDG